MAITDSQAIASILKPVNGAALKRASEDNERQRFHVGPATDEKDAGPYLVKLKARVERILANEDKFKRFCSLLNFPLPSSRLIDKSADEYLKSFKAEDRYIDFEFSSDSYKPDAAVFLDEIGFDDWLQKNLFNQCLRASAAVWIVDLPAEVNESGFATPIMLIREAGELTDMFLDRRGNVTAVIYPMSPVKGPTGEKIADRWAVIDDESFRTFIRRGSEEPTRDNYQPHALNRCPSNWIWHDKLDERKPFRIQSPLHAIFSDLDDLVIGNVFRQHVDLYASFPVLWRYKEKCSYVSNDSEPCRSGKVTYYPLGPDGKFQRDEEGKKIKAEKDCPVCAKRKPIGPGSTIDVPRPQSSDSPNLANPAGFINAERDLLDYNVEKLESLKADILEALTGDSNNVDQTKDAVNQDQVQARFEARKGILAYWASHLQRTHTECLSVLLELRYGPLFIDVSVDYGTEFHLLSPAQAIADYDTARKANLPMYQLAIRRKRIDKLLAGSNEKMVTRLELLAMLEPYPDQPLAVLAAGSDAYELKANFDQYITRFEAENVGLELFGKALALQVKVKSITEILYQYVTDGKPRRQVPEPAGGAKPEPVNG